MKVFQLGSIDSNFQILSVLYKVDWTVLNYVAQTINKFQGTKVEILQLTVKDNNILIVN